MSELKQFDMILEEHHTPAEQPIINSGLRDKVEQRLIRHRSSNPELNEALRRLHQLRVEKKRMEKEIARYERLVEAFLLS